MIYFANPVGMPQLLVQLAERGLVGFIDTPKQRNPIPTGVSWCADNGCFGNGWLGEDKWLAWLAKRAAQADTCWFATAPDVVGNAASTLRRARLHLADVRALGYKAALVAQDGIETTTVPWDDFDVLFLGGTTQFKIGPWARAYTSLALRRGKQVHMGRVNSMRRILYAASIGCTSCDGTHLAFKPSDARVDEVRRWVQAANRQEVARAARN